MLTPRRIRLLVLAVVLSVWTARVEAQRAGDRTAALDYLGRGTQVFRVGDLVAAAQNRARAIEMCRLVGPPDLEAQAAGATR